MVDIEFKAETPSQTAARWRAPAREVGLGLAYWLGFLLVLEPDNILRMIQAGHAVSWSQEGFRILGAAVLGAAATPSLLALTRRFPVDGGAWVRGVAMQAAFAAVAAAGLILVSCLLAEWALPAERRPLTVAIREEFVANWPLLVFAIAGLLAIANAARFLALANAARRGASTIQPFLVTVPVKARGRTVLVDVSAIDWIETQGNYLALHVGPATHLIRESLGRLETRLDPKRFVRVHRRAMVAADRIREITPLGAGDAALSLVGGAELRLSRGYRARLDALLGMAGSRSGAH